MGSGKGLGELLAEIEEAYEKDLADIDQYELENSISKENFNKEEAEELIINILSQYGSNFILDILEQNGTQNFKKSHLIKSMYEKLCNDNPKEKKENIRKAIFKHFNITDKAVQKHIYK